MQKAIIVSNEISNSIKEKVEFYGFLPLLSCKVDKLDTPVATHPDLQIISVGGVLYAAENCYDYYRALFEKNGIKAKLLPTEKAVFSPYPNDCVLNIAFFKNCVIKGENTEIPAAFAPFNSINVKQGYVNCSVLKLNDNAAITEDISIFKALTDLGVDVLFLPERRAILEGYNCGFIGGAGFVFDGKVFFFGNIESFPYFNKIYEFCKKHGFEAVSLSEEKIADYGKAVIL